MNQLKIRTTDGAAAVGLNFEAKEMFVKNAIIPNSFYCVVSNGGDPAYYDNNKFYLSENGGAATLITIKEGTYATTAALSNALEYALNTYSPGGIVYNVSISSDNGKATITIASGSFSLLFGSYPSDARIVMGFNAADTAAAGTITSDFSTSLTPFSSLELSFPELIGFEDSRYIGNIDGIGKIQASFPLSGGYNSYLKFYKNSAYQVMIRMKSYRISSLTPQLFVCDSNNSLKRISLHGQPMEILIDWH